MRLGLDDQYDRSVLQSTISVLQSTTSEAVLTWKETDDIAEAESAAGPVVQRPKMNATVTESTFSLLNVAESGRFKAERS